MSNPSPGAVAAFSCCRTEPIRRRSTADCIRSGPDTKQRFMSARTCRVRPAMFGGGRLKHESSNTNRDDSTRPETKERQHFTAVREQRRYSAPSPEGQRMTETADGTTAPRRAAALLLAAWRDHWCDSKRRSAGFWWRCCCPGRRAAWHRHGDLDRRGPFTWMRRRSPLADALPASALPLASCARGGRNISGPMPLLVRAIGVASVKP